MTGYIDGGARGNPGPAGWGAGEHNKDADRLANQAMDEAAQVSEDASSV